LALQGLTDDGQTVGAAVARKLKPATTQPSIVRYGVGPNAAPYALAGNDASAWDVERRALRSPGWRSLVRATQELVEEFAASFPYVVVDCPPGQTVMAEAAILKADLLLCPTSPDRLGLWGLETFQTYLRELFEDHQRPPAKAYWIVTKFRGNASETGPQAVVMNRLLKFTPPADLITLLVEAGQAGLGGPIVVPTDANVPKRLEGPRSLKRTWPWDASYKGVTRDAFARLRTAVLRELEIG
jgi:hypothetical protein